MKKACWSTALTLVSALAVVLPVSAQTYILCPDSTYDRVAALDPMTGDYLFDFIAVGQSTFSTPICAIQTELGVLVSDQVADNVQLFNDSGVFQSVFISGVDNLRGIARGPDGNIYTTSGGTDHVSRWKGSDGSFIDHFIPNGSGGMTDPFDVFFRSNGNILVSSSSVDELFEYDSNGVFLGLFGDHAVDFGEQIAEARNGNILVAEFSDNEITEFSPDGFTVIRRYSLIGARGVIELGNGDILGTNGSEISRFDRNTGQKTVLLTGGSWRYLEPYTVIPEPGTMSLIGLAGIAVLRSLRRR